MGDRSMFIEDILLDWRFSFSNSINLEIFFFLLEDVFLLFR